MVRNAIIRCLLVLCAAFLLPWQVAVAGCYSSAELPDQSDKNNDPIKVTKCFGAFSCAVCNVIDTADGSSTATNWKKPSIRVIYPYGLTTAQAGNIVAGECGWLQGVRFCARTASAGMYGNETKPEDPGGERPQVCAYEDWMDGMDTDPGHSPYHHNTRNKSGITAAGGAMAGAAVGGITQIIGPMGMAIGASIGALVGAIMEFNNHVVPTELGCVERPIATGPPVWCNECWGQKYLPLPLVDYSPDSSFFNPSMTLYFCEKTMFDNASEDWITTGQPTPCKFVRDSLGNFAPNPSDPTQPPGLAVGMRSVSTLVLNPKPTAANAGERTVKDEQSVNFTYTTVGHTPGQEDKRTFIAKVTVSNPSQICVYLKKGGGASEVAISCLPRPGYMPLPIVEEGVGSLFNVPKLGVKFTGDPTGKAIQIWEDPALYGYTTSDPGHECNILHQVTFCAKRRCLDPEGMMHEIGNPASTPVAGKAACLDWEKSLCLVGYNTAPQVVSLPYKTTPVPGGYSFYGKAIAGLPNTEYLVSPPSAPIVSKGNPEFVGGVAKTVDISLSVDAWAFTPPKCYEYDGAGRCVNVDGTCVGTNAAGECTNYLNNQASDPYAIDDVPADPPVAGWAPTQVLRAMEAEELGLCVGNPVDGTEWTQLAPKDIDNPSVPHSYTVPENCAELSVEMWGAGGGGSFDNGFQWFGDDSGRNDESGGAAGGYVKVVGLTVGLAGSGSSLMESSSYNVFVGAGGVPCWANHDSVAWPQCISHSGNSVGGKTIFAPTGAQATGGGWGRYNQGHGVPGIGMCGGGYTSCVTNNTTVTPTFSDNFGEWPQSCGTGGPLKGGSTWDASIGYTFWPDWSSQCDESGDYDPDMHLKDPAVQYAQWLAANPGATSAQQSAQQQYFKDNINDRKNLKFPPYQGMGGCSSSVPGPYSCTSGGDDDSRAGPGAHGGVKIKCTKKHPAVLAYPGGP